MTTTSVLFLCTGNRARSQMAEAVLRNLAADRFEAFSAGLEPTTIHPLTYRVMAEIGLDLHGHRSKSLKEYLGRHHFHHVITVCDHAEQNCPTTFPGHPTRHHWNLPDPTTAPGTETQRLTVFRDVRDAVRSQVSRFIEAST